MALPLLAAATLSDALRRSFRRWPERTALTSDGWTLSYSDVEMASDRLARMYHRQGVRRGDRVVCQLPSGPGHLVAAIAAWRCAAVHVGIDHEVTERELSWVIDETQPAILLCRPAATVDDPRGWVRRLGHRHPGTRVLTETELHGDGTDRVATAAAAVDRDQPRAAAPAEDAEGPLPDDPAVILFTSGTTGRPKGPVGYHEALVDGWEGVAGALGLGPEDVHLGHLPLAHGFGLSMAVMALMTGGRLVLVDRFSAGDALRLISEEDVTVFNGTPAHFILLTDRLDPAHHDVSSLRIGVGTAAAFPPALLRRVFHDLGMELMLMYGSSEGVGVVTTDREEMLRGSVGRPEPGSVRIVDPGGASLPPGEIGEIAFKPGFSAVRYWQRGGAGSASGISGQDGGAVAAENPTGEASSNWYRSGDLGRLDEEGRLYVLGRLKHQVDRGGIKVDPGEVEELLLRCPGVADAAIIGTANPVLGETVCACVVPLPGERPMLSELRTALAQDLAPHKLPEELCLLPALPRTEIGKVDRARLSQQAEAMENRERLRPR